MALPRIEVGVGLIDGVNSQFFTPTAYEAGSVRYYLNGQLLQETCLVEISATTGEVQLVEIPRVGDVVQLFYLDALGSTGVLPPEELLCPLDGVLREEFPVEGAIFNEFPLAATLELDTVVQGDVFEEVLLAALLYEEVQIEGTLTECDA